jgi:hypothetical protein
MERGKHAREVASGCLRFTVRFRREFPNVLGLNHTHYSRTMTIPHWPTNSSRVRLVGSFSELLSTPWADGVNALCWPRDLDGDFGEVVARLGVGEQGIVALDEKRLRALPLSVAGWAAADAMLEDFRRLREHGLDPALNCIHGYPRDEAAWPTDVFSFHADSAPFEADTWLCTYHGAPSEGLANEEARRRTQVPEARAALLRLHGGAEGEAFEEFLRENCHDLHYAPTVGARPFSFGVGNLWRIACDWPGSPVPPCIHRAPDSPPADPPRLLLIS